MGLQCRILIVDGDDSIREFIAMALSAEGYEVHVAPHKQTALQLIPTLNPHVVILDLHLSINDTSAILALCHEHTDRYIPVIGLSTSNKGAELAEQAGVDEFLPKPFDLEELLTLCEHFRSAVAGR